MKGIVKYYSITVNNCAYTSPSHYLSLCQCSKHELLLERRRSFSNFERFTSSEVSEHPCESGGIEAKTSSFKKTVTQVGHI
jgi:hypothetical protein